MSVTLFLLLSFSQVIPLVLGHGFVTKVTINGKEYQGNSPSDWGGKAVKSPIRRIKIFDPMYGADNKGLTCGNGAEKTAALVAEADPGSEVTFLWMANPTPGDSAPNWPHDLGPLMTYMASCGDQSCKDYDATNAQWFKIDETGKKKNSGKWVQEDLMKRKPYTTKLPENVKPGEYIIRHEIIALHLATDIKKAEYYVSCTQVNITGNGTGAPRSNETVTFPGTGYHDKDPGLFNTWEVFTNPDSDLKKPYQMPGPKIAQFVLHPAAVESDGEDKNGAESYDGTRLASPSPSSSSNGTETSGSKPKGSEDSNCLRKRTAKWRVSNLH